MSSSVFIERSSLSGTDADSNLVIVYGKNRTNFDHNGLQKLIEEKQLSSISVVRISSPTPSMEAEEETAEALSEDGSDADCDGELDVDKKDENSRLNSIDLQDSDEIPYDIEKYSDNENDSNKTFGTKRRRKKVKNPKQKKVMRYGKKDRPEVVGLSVEEFYPTEEANVLVKNVLRRAGVSTLKQSDYEFMLYVIKNDHCYTRFTSPEELKKRLPVEKQAPSPRKVQQTSLPTSQFVIPEQQQTYKKKAIFISSLKKTSNTTLKLKEEKEVIANNDRHGGGELILGKKCTNENEIKADAFNETQKETCTSKSYSNNVTDLDLNRAKEIKQNITTEKITNPDLSFEKTLLIKVPECEDNKSEKGDTKAELAKDEGLNNEPKPSQINSTVILARPSPITVKVSSTSTTPKKLPETITSAKYLIKSNNTQQAFKNIPITIRSSKLQTEGPSTSSKLFNTRTVIQHQPVKEFIINKSFAAPKSGFININTLIMETDKKNTTPTTSSIESGTKVSTCSGVTPTKGFMPLGIETASKNMLPAQISLQTHQSSSEMSSESEKQFDLIDLIVNDEMQKPNTFLSTKNFSRDIPELVKMLESTETSMKTKKNEHQMTSFTSSSSVCENIDISNAPLLESHGDDIPDDILEHVVDLMEGDKTLQDSVKKPIFTDSTNESVKNTTPVFKASMPYQIPLQEASNKSAPVPGSSGVMVPIIHAETHTCTELPQTTLQTKQPIKIVRGNGRVITLPPIEAPTTRAKKRAQVYGDYGLNQSGSFENLSLQAPEPMNVPVELNESEKPPIETVRLRTSKEETPGNTKPAKRSNSSRRSSAAKVASANKSKNNSDTAESQGNDDDDPNKLWCVCRQPHNNRFMICCDVCEDWFHGTCVNISRAQGLEMEQKEIEWTCPNCLQKEEEKKQPKITEMLLPKCPSTASISSLTSKNSSTSGRNIQPVSLNRSQAATSPTTKLLSKQQQNTDLSSKKKSIVEVKRLQHSSHISIKDLELFKKAPAVNVAVNEQKKTSATAKIVEITPTKKRLEVSEMKQLKSHPIQEYRAKIQQNSLEERIESICIVCNKAARPNAIYCSDECIRKHAHNAMLALTSKTSESIATNQLIKIVPVADDKKKKTKELFEDLLAMPDRKRKPERISVFERKSGRVLMGSLAPTTINLKKWLQENPTFEVIQPGSNQAMEIEKKQKRAVNSFTSVDSGNIKMDLLDKRENFSEPIEEKSSDINTSLETADMFSKQVNKKGNNIPLNTSPRPHAIPLKNLQKHSHQLSVQAEPLKAAQEGERKMEVSKNKDKSTKRQTLDNSGQKNDSVSAPSDSEPNIRSNVCRTLKEQLILRLDEQIITTSNDKKLCPEEVADFVTQTEEEMFHYFGRDTGSKYRAKYRSLIFNIKDKKNQTLIAKICSKEIQPKQLVRMTPEELASQELAQWRENEVKHQIEMIKKSELDLLTCAKNYVLKTHKGEKIIESKASEIAVPEEVESVLNHSISSPKRTISISTTTATVSTKDLLHRSGLEFMHRSDHVEIKSTNSNLEEKLKEQKSKEKGNVRGGEHERDRNQNQEKHPSKDRHRDTLRSKKHSRSRSRSRSNSQSKEKRHKSHKDNRYGRESERMYRVDEKRNRDKHQRSSHCSVEDTEIEDNKGVTTDRHHGELSTTESKTISSCNSSTSKRKINENSVSSSKKTSALSLETFSLVDKILESTKTVEEAANIVPERECIASVSSTSDHSSLTISKNRNIQNSSVAQDSEHVIIKSTPSLDPYKLYNNCATDWSGKINMIDVASFQINLQPITGNSGNMHKLLPVELDIVGRIVPETVWDYITKIKKSPNKEIVLIRLVPASNTETEPYSILYQYLENRERLGVIRTYSPHIKDFYVFPLGAKAEIPVILQTTENIDFLENPYRPDLLIGVMVRVMGKRPPASSSHANLFPTKRQRVNNPDDGISPPNSPNCKKQKEDEIDIDAIIKAPISTRLKKSTTLILEDDLNEPYSPGGSSNGEDYPATPLAPSLHSKASGVPQTDLTWKMEEIDRKIRVQEMEIAHLLNSDPPLAQSTRTVQPHFSNISIPSNLPQILASIKNKSECSMLPTDSATVSSPANITLLNSNRRLFSVPHDPEDVNTPDYDLKVQRRTKAGSRLAQLSEVELLSMVPDEMRSQTLLSASQSETQNQNKVGFNEPPPPGV